MVFLQFKKGAEHTLKTRWILCISSLFFQLPVNLSVHVQIWFEKNGGVGPFDFGGKDKGKNAYFNKFCVFSSRFLLQSPKRERKPPKISFKYVVPHSLFAKSEESNGLFFWKRGVGSYFFGGEGKRVKNAFLRPVFCSNPEKRQKTIKSYWNTHFRPFLTPLNLRHVFHRAPKRGRPARNFCGQPKRMASRRPCHFREADHLRQAWYFFSAVS